MPPGIWLVDLEIESLNTIDDVPRERETPPRLNEAILSPPTSTHERKKAENLTIYSQKRTPVRSNEGTKRGLTRPIFSTGVVV